MNEAMGKYPPRPGINDAIRKEAAKNWIEEYGTYYNDRAKKELFAILASGTNISDDGFDLGQLVENETSIKADFQLCESLNNFSQFLFDALHKAEWAWVKGNHIEPPYPIGTRVRYSIGIGEQFVVITGICTNVAASYLVKPDDQSIGGSWVVYFEDVETINDDQ